MLKGIKAGKSSNLESFTRGALTRRALIARWWIAFTLVNKSWIKVTWKLRNFFATSYYVRELFETEIPNLRYFKQPIKSLIFNDCFLYVWNEPCSLYLIKKARPSAGNDTRASLWCSWEELNESWVARVLSKIRFSACQCCICCEYATRFWKHAHGQGMQCLRY